MKGKLPYTSSIKDMPFMFSEMRRTAKLLCEGKKDEDIVRLSMERNIYQLEKEKRKRDVPLRMLKRLDTIGMPLINAIANGHDYDAKIIAFFALMKADRLLFEFMYEVYADRYRSGSKEITEKDFLEFIERKAQNSDVVAKWTPNNLIRVRNTFMNVLCEAGLVKRSGNNLLIQKPVLDSHMRNLLSTEAPVYIKAMLLEV